MLATLTNPGQMVWACQSRGEPVSKSHQACDHHVQAYRSQNLAGTSRAILRCGNKARANAVTNLVALATHIVASANLDFCDVSVTVLGASLKQPLSN